MLKTKRKTICKEIIHDKKKEYEINNNSWTSEEIRKVFLYFKLHGTKWSEIAKRFPTKSPSSIKNKFYTTLKRVATRAQLENPTKFPATFVKCKRNLIQFVDSAIKHAEKIPSKRGRKGYTERLLAEQNAILFPSSKEDNRFENQPIQTIPNPPLITFPDPISFPYYCRIPMPVQVPIPGTSNQADDRIEGLLPFNPSNQNIS